MSPHTGEDVRGATDFINRCRYRICYQSLLNSPRVNTFFAMERNKLNDINISDLHENIEEDYYIFPFFPVEVQ